MKKVILWFFLCCKRYLKRIPFLLLLAALPLTALAASRMENGKDGTVRIAVCCLDPEPASLGNRLKENLLARDTGLFSFYPCENEQQVRDHVAARKAECGYLIPENLEQKINSGRFKRSITVFSAPSTVTASLSTEVVFSELAAIRNKMLGFIFQQYNLLPKLTLQENVEVPLMYAGIPKPERHERSRIALEMVGLGDKLRNKPSQLSGGQQQRASIARALAGDPAVILADEPTGALDSHTGREVLTMLQQLHAAGNTVVLITHDNSIAVQAQRIIRLEDGHVIYDGDAGAPEAVVTPNLAGRGMAG